MLLSAHLDSSDDEYMSVVEDDGDKFYESNESITGEEVEDDGDKFYESNESITGEEDEGGNDEAEFHGLNNSAPLDDNSNEEFHEASEGWYFFIFLGVIFL